MDHLADSDVEGFLKGALPEEDFRRVVRHLVKGCRACGARIAATVPQNVFLPADPPPDESYDDAIDRAWKKVRPLARRWKEDQARLDRGIQWLRESTAGFSGLTHGQRQSLVPWVHIEVLLQRAFDVRYSDPQKMLRHMESARYVVDQLEKTPYGPSFLADLRVRVWTELGNAYRVNENYRYAEAALRKARRFLEQGTGNLLLEARIDDIEASLRKDQRLFSHACELLDEVYQTYRKFGERHLSGRALVSKGIVLALAQKPREAARMFLRALPLLDASRDPQLFTSAQHNLLDSQVDAGDIHGAVHTLVQSGLREKFADEPLNRARLRWVEGKILVLQKRHAEAEQIFGEIRSCFREQKLEYVAAVAGVDQVTALLEQGKKTDAHLLAYDLMVVFRQHVFEEGVHREAYKAIVFLAETCRMRMATVATAAAVRSFLDRSEKDKGLRFDIAGILRLGLEGGKGGKAR